LERSRAKWSQLLSISSRFRHVLKFRDPINKSPGKFLIRIGIHLGGLCRSVGQQDLPILNWKA